MQKFSKLYELNINQAHCSKKCLLENVNCSEKGHTIKYEHLKDLIMCIEGKQKRKFGLWIRSFACTLKEKLKGFARHQHNVNHTSNICDQAINLLSEGAII